MSGWNVLPFEQVVADITGGNIKTPQSEYLENGDLPIVDQGKDLISGYTNDKNRAVKGNCPAIVFGDHTRCLKYIDFPFGIGADGVKVLVPQIDMNVKYLYYFLRSIRLPNGGYDRHFKYLRREEVRFPDRPKQDQIVKVLEHAEKLMDSRRHAIEKANKLTQSIFLEMFGDPVTNERQYPARPMIDIVDAARPITYGILMPGPDQREGVKYVRVVDMRDGGIDLGNIRKTSQEISNQYRRSLLRTNDVLMSIRGHVGRLALTPPELDGANITQDTVRLAIKGASPVFVMELLRTPSCQYWMARHTKGVAVKGINLTDIKKMPIILPPEKLQIEFELRARSISKLLANCRRGNDSSSALFVSLQQRAFAGDL